jgi:hypothetical protein
MTKSETQKGRICQVCARAIDHANQVCSTSLVWKASVSELWLRCSWPVPSVLGSSVARIARANDTRETAVSAAESSYGGSR